MSYRAALHIFLLVAGFAALAAAQPSATPAPVTKSEVFMTLDGTAESEELIRRNNASLIAEIQSRGVDFVLTPAEEWSLQLRDASEELLDAIRNAVDPNEREFRLKVQRQKRLYDTFAASYNGSDLASRQAALNAAREFVDLYAADPNVAEIVAFMQRSLPRLQQSVASMQQREAALERARIQAAERADRRAAQAAERERQRRESAANNTNRATQSAAPATPPTQKEPQPANGLRREFPAVRRP